MKYIPQLIDQLVDIFYDGDIDTITELPSQRLATKNTHGTGCTLSSAIAAHLVRGVELLPAVQAAKEYLTGAIVAGSDYALGGGHGPVHHFHQLWQ